MNGQQFGARLVSLPASQAVVIIKGMWDEESLDQPLDFYGGLETKLTNTLAGGAYNQQRPAQDNVRAGRKSQEIRFAANITLLYNLNEM